MSNQLIIGYDPGGNNAHGIADLEVRDGIAKRLRTRNLGAVEDIIDHLDSLHSLTALGIDTLTCWGTGPGGWRPSDRWLRANYPDVHNSVISPNGLYGSMGLNGMSVAIVSRQRFPNVFITETHPKVLFWHLTQMRYDYSQNRRAMDAALAEWLGIAVDTNTEHEWDAALSAFVAFEGSAGRWSFDLHKLPTKENERLIEPCGETHYSWPT